MKRCNAQKRKGCLWGAHVCKRRKGHPGKHRCGLKSEGTMEKPNNPPILCSEEWGRAKGDPHAER